jgi:YHS domain-containing protein
LALTVFFAQAGGGVLLAAEPKAEAVVKSGAVCPVTARPVSPAVSIEYQGAKLYFSSPDCIPTFQANVAKYASRANYQLVVTGQARQVACPFTGKPLNPNIPTEKVYALDVGFCCRACQQTVAGADMLTRLDLVFGDAFKTGYVIDKK